jgi:hypothetical protein
MDEQANEFAAVDMPLGTNRTRMKRALHSYQDSDRELRMLQNRVAVLREKQAKVAQ